MSGRRPVSLSLCAGVAAVMGGCIGGAEETQQARSEEVCRFIQNGVDNGMFPYDTTDGRQSAPSDSATTSRTLIGIHDYEVGEDTVDDGIIHTTDDVDWYSVLVVDDFSFIEWIQSPFDSWDQEVGVLNPTVWIEQSTNLGPHTSSLQETQLEVCLYYLDKDQQPVRPESCVLDTPSQGPAPDGWLGCCERVGYGVAGSASMDLPVGSFFVDDSGTLVMAVRSVTNECGFYTLKYAAHSLSEY